MTTPPSTAFRGIDDVRLVGRQVYYEQLNFWLNPVGALFTVGFSVVFLVLLAASAGNSHIAFYGNIRIVQYYVPGFAAYGVMAACFNMLTISLVVRREMGLLKRMRLSPLPTWVLLSAIFCNALLISAVQVVILLLIGRFGYQVVLPHNIAALVVTLVVGGLCFTALGIATSTLIPNQDAAGPVVSIVFFVLLFLSGLWYPIKAGSGLAKFSSYFPVRHMIIATFAPFDLQKGASAWRWGDLRVMAIWAVGGVIVASASLELGAATQRPRSEVALPVGPLSLSTPAAVPGLLRRAPVARRACGQARSMSRVSSMCPRCWVSSSRMCSSTAPWLRPNGVSRSPRSPVGGAALGSMPARSVSSWRRAVAVARDQAVHVAVRPELGGPVPGDGAPGRTAAPPQYSMTPRQWVRMMNGEFAPGRSGRALATSSPSWRTIATMASSAWSTNHRKSLVETSSMTEPPTMPPRIGSG